MAMAWRRLRPSNLVMLAAVPFIVYLFATAPDYQRSLRAIAGVDPGSGAQVPGFLLLLAMSAAGTFAAWRGRRGATGPMTFSLAAASAVLAALAALTPLVLPFAHAVVANAVDPFTSDLVLRSVTPRQLTPEAEALVSWLTSRGLLVLAALNLASLLHALFAHRIWRRWGWNALLVLNACLLAGLLLFAYIGFAAGIALTLRAALFAYALALVLGLLWVGLLQLKPSMKAQILGASLAGLLGLGAAITLLQTPERYVAAGDLTGATAIIKGTPQALVTALRLAQFPNAPEVAELAVKSFATETAALEAVKSGKDVTAILIRAEAAPMGLPVLWQTSAIADRALHRGIALLVAAILIGLMCFAGYTHGRHPLAVTAEFIIDTIRGIPMLVIVLYVGLPLSGALKDATQGILDPPNFLRGITAMGIAYSAYLAEIMRAGVKAIPRGQFEAAASLGLTRWQAARLIVVPQAFRIILPALGNELIAIIKDTSLLSILSIRDITQRTREFQSASFLPFAPYNTAAIIYVILTLAAASLLAALERRHDIKQR